MKKLLFIFNPKSGKGLIKNKLLEIIDIFVKNDYEPVVYPTQKREDAKEKVMEIGEYFDLIVCSGGDGTVNEICSGMLEANINKPIGYIPTGSTNDFAKSVAIPNNMINAANIAVSRNELTVDMGKFNGRTFVYVAAFGAFTEVSYATSQSLKNMLGHQAYIVEGVKQIVNIKTHHMKITNEIDTYEDDFIYGMVTNAKSVGGFKGIAGKHVKLDDGVFETVFIKKIRNPIDLNSVIGVLLGTIKDSERIIRFKTKNVAIESDDEIPWVVDGEYGGIHKNVNIINEPKQITFRVGRMNKKLKSN